MKARHATKSQTKSKTNTGRQTSFAFLALDPTTGLAKTSFWVQHLVLQVVVSPSVSVHIHTQTPDEFIEQLGEKPRSIIQYNSGNVERQACPSSWRFWYPVATGQRRRLETPFPTRTVCGPKPRLEQGSLIDAADGFFERLPPRRQKDISIHDLYSDKLTLPDATFTTYSTRSEHFLDALRFGHIRHEAVEDSQDFVHPHACAETPLRLC